MDFVLHPQLAADTIEVARLELSVVRLMDDRTWPWLVLVPARPDAIELIDLSDAERHRLMDEISLASTVIRDLFQPDKINVAALGNQVSQLHVHVIARFRRDPAWPRPVWGTAARAPYRPHERDTTIAALQDGFERAAASSPHRPQVEPDAPATFWSFLGFTDR